VFELMFSNNETVTDSITGLVTAIFGEHDPVALVRHYQICIRVYIYIYIYIYIYVCMYVCMYLLVTGICFKSSTLLSNIVPVTLTLPRICTQHLLVILANL